MICHVNWYCQALIDTIGMLTWYQEEYFNFINEINYLIHLSPQPI